MGYMSLQLLQQKFRQPKAKKSLQDKRIQLRVTQELQDKLADYLDIKGNDKVMFEVSNNALPHFMTALNDRLLVMYEYEQVDANKFIFWNREIDI